MTGSHTEVEKHTIRAQKTEKDTISIVLFSSNQGIIHFMEQTLPPGGEKFAHKMSILNTNINSNDYYKASKCILYTLKPQPHKQVC